MGLNTAFYSRPEEIGEMKYFNVNFTMHYYLEKGIPNNKINLGFATYGRSFKLASSIQTNIGDPAFGPGESGKVMCL